MEFDETKNGAKPESEGAPRRKFLGWLVGVINLGVFTSIILPTLGFLGSPLKRKDEKGVWVPVLPDHDLSEGSTRAVTYQIEVKDGYRMAQRKYSVYLHRKGEKVVAYDPSCPHLGCHVEFKERKKRYVCPCHGGVFDEDGNVLSGPPPRGLKKIDTKIEGGQIWVYKA